MVFLYLDQVAHPFYSPGVPISQKCCQIWGPKSNPKPRSGIFPENVRDVPRVSFNPLGNYVGTQKSGLYLYVWGTPLAYYLFIWVPYCPTWGTWPYWQGRSAAQHRAPRGMWPVADFAELFLTSCDHSYDFPRAP